MRLALAAALALCGAAAQAQDFPQKLPAPGGEVIIPSAQARQAYDAYHFAPARRAGDYLYVSGVIVAPRPGAGPLDAAGLTERTSLVLERLVKPSLDAAGVTFADVVMLNSFHVWDGPGFKGTRDEQFAAFSAGLGAHIKAPWPAWTAVGTTGLLDDNGVVEVQFIVYAPQTRG